VLFAAVGKELTLFTSARCFHTARRLSNTVKLPAVMKRVSILRVAAIFVPLSLAAQASAELLLYEPFDYTPGEGLAGMNGQVGADGPTPATGAPHRQVAPNGNSWMSGFYNANNPYNQANDAVTIATDLSYMNLLKQPGTGSVTLGGGGSIPRLAYTPIKNAPDGSEVDAYYSFIFRLDSLTGTSAAGGLIAALNNSRGSQAADINSAGASVHAKASGDGFVLGVLEMARDSSQATYDTSVLDFGETYFVVGKYTIRGTLNGGAAQTFDDSAQIWINPTSLGGAEPAGALLALNERPDLPTNQGDGAVAQTFLLRQDGFGGTIASAPANIVIDELRVGTTWADVTPVAAGQPGDFNGDGTVDAADYVHFRKTGDGDYAHFFENFGEPNSGGGSPVPEPASVVLIAMGCGCLFVFRNR
jgi:hypothetical protein